MGHKLAGIGFALPARIGAQLHCLEFFQQILNSLCLVSFSFCAFFLGFLVAFSSIFHHCNLLLEITHHKLECCYIFSVVLFLVDEFQPLLDCPVSRPFQHFFFSLILLTQNIVLPFGSVQVLSEQKNIPSLCGHLLDACQAGQTSCCCNVPQGRKVVLHIVQIALR